MTPRPFFAAVVAVLLMMAAAGGVAQGQPPAPAPAPGPGLPTSHKPLPPGHQPGNTGGGEESEVPIRPPKTGAPDWNRFGGDPVDAPRDLNSFVTAVLGWMRTASLIAGVLGVLTIAGMLVVGLRWRSEQSRRALDALPVVLLGTVISGSAATVLSMVL